MIHDIEILCNYGGIQQNSLSHIVGELDDTDLENGEPELFENSHYMDEDGMAHIFSTNSNKITVLSLNCQSIFAKFEEINIYVNSLRQKGIFFNVICLQETWIAENMDISLLNIDGYKLKTEPRL